MINSALLQVAFDGLLLGAVYAAIGVTLTLIFGVMRIVTFCHGEFLMVALYLTFSSVTWLGLNSYLSILVVLPAMLLFAVVVYYVIIEPVLSRNEHNQIVTTLAFGLVLENLALMIFTADMQTIPSAFAASTFRLGSLIVRTPVAITACVSLTLCIALGWVLHSTKIGRQIRATSQDKDAAALCGVHVDRVYLFAFCVGLGFLAIIAVLLAPTLYVSPLIGLNYTLTAFVIVVLGSLGNFLGAIIGGFIVGMVESVGGLVTSGSMPFALTFGLFTIILLFRPQGMFGTARL
jgi:branched-chain amino acid transport system permease protein